jgi:hypothetical protein
MNLLLHFCSAQPSTFASVELTTSVSALIVEASTIFLMFCCYYVDNISFEKWQLKINPKFPPAKEVCREMTYLSLNVTVSSTFLAIATLMASNSQESC